MARRGWLPANEGGITCRQVLQRVLGCGQFFVCGGFGCPYGVYYSFVSPASFLLPSSPTHTDRWGASVWRSLLEGVHGLSKLYIRAVLWEGFLSCFPGARHCLGVGLSKLLHLNMYFIYATSQLFSVQVSVWSIALSIGDVYLGNGLVWGWCQVGVDMSVASGATVWWWCTRGGGDVGGGQGRRTSVRIWEMVGLGGRQRQGERLGTRGRWRLSQQIINRQTGPALPGP